MHHQMQHSPELRASLPGKTALITGSARGIGAATAALFNKHGANVVITDLPFLRGSAEELIPTLSYPERAIFVPASITEWKQLTGVFKQGIASFGQIDIVVANAGIMESNTVLDIDVDENGDPIESTEAIKVLDVNLKGTFNTLRLALHYLSNNNPPDPAQNNDRGSIVLVSSTSGYFGTTGNAAYIASKHGTVGLLRASQMKAAELGIRVNSIAPSYTPTYITAGFGDSIEKAGLEANTPEMVGTAIVFAAVDPERRGTCCLVAGRFLRELELTQASSRNDWLGRDLAESMAKFGEFLAATGGYKLPPVTKIV